MRWRYLGIEIGKLVWRFTRTEKSDFLSIVLALLEKSKAKKRL